MPLLNLVFARAFSCFLKCLIYKASGPRMHLFRIFPFSSIGSINLDKSRLINLRLKVSFEGEPPGTYRIYDYKWVSDNEYLLSSVQYDKNNFPTGLFYGGTFIRINKN